MNRPRASTLTGSLANGLKLCLFFGEGAGDTITDSVTGVAGTVTGAMTYQWPPVGSLGTGFKQTSNGPYLDFGTIAARGISNEITFATLAVFDPAPIGTGQNITRTMVAYHGFSPSFGIADKSNTDGVSGPGWVATIETVTTDRNIAVTPSAGLTTLNPNVADLIVATYDGHAFRAYLNGVAAGSISDSSGLALTATDHITVTGWAANTQSFNQPLLFAALWNRALSAAEVLALSSTPPIPRPVGPPATAMFSR